MLQQSSWKINFPPMPTKGIPKIDWGLNLDNTYWISICESSMVSCHTRKMCSLEVLHLHPVITLYSGKNCHRSKLVMSILMGSLGQVLEKVTSNRLHLTASVRDNGLLSFPS